MSYRIGVDLGGTKIEVIALAEDGTVRWQHRVATPQGDYAGTVQAVVDLVLATEQRLGGGASVGIGTPGSPSAKSGLMRNCNSVCLNGQALPQDLQRLLQRPVRLANDANCLALSEATDGAGAGAAVVFAVILGTGIGGGVVVNGQVLLGRNHVAGEWGHNPLPWPDDEERPGAACYCGKSGCIETFLSGPGFAAGHNRCHSAALTPRDIVSSARAGDPACRGSLERYLERLAKSLAQVINLLDPDVIVLGGGMSNITELYNEVPRRWEKYIFSDSVQTRLLPARYGDSSGVRGAAWLGRS